MFSNKEKSIGVCILPASEATNINTSAWDNLSENSIYKNPFYQRWNLLAALTHFTTDHVYIVTLETNKKLIGLFPIILLQPNKTIKSISVWRHKHCYLTDPLLLEKIDYIKIINTICKKLNASWFQSDVHTPNLLPKRPGSYRYSFSRAAIINEPERPSPPNISKRRNKNNHKKLHKDFDIKHIEHHDINSGLVRFCELEHKGWKGKAGGSILSDINTRNYYFKLAENVTSKHLFSFQELWADEHLIAMNMRITLKDYWYDVKTSYDEEFKKYSPGKTLEIKNVELLKNQQFKMLDSCTNPDNTLINKLWPDQLALQSTHVFIKTFKSQACHLFYLIKKAPKIIKHFS